MVIDAVQAADGGESVRPVCSVRSPWLEVRMKIGMAAQPQRFDHGQAMIVKSSGVVRGGIQIRYGPEFSYECQPSGRAFLLFPAGKAAPSRPANKSS
jgi:hypothetical protein